jgi:dihydroxy-acid dehydratase/L-arabonate dehydrase
VSGTGSRPLRSQNWFGSGDFLADYFPRSWLKNQGIPDRMLSGRPVIGICNTFSELTPCNAHLREIATHVKHGVFEAGGLPLEFPVMSLGETLIRPTSMLFRNLVSMDVEESIRGNPVDGVVLLCGCDKTTPALLMGAGSCDLPTIVVSGGPMLSGRYRGAIIGSGTSVYSMAEEVRAGEITLEAFMASESCMSRSAGHCNTMGTASTMASVVEAIGLGLPQNASIPAVDSRRRLLAHDAGRRIVEMVEQDLTMSGILTRAAFENAIRVNAAIGGSTNAVVHLLALAGRVGVELELEDFDRWGHDMPLLVDLMPSGEHLMEDFHYAGGLPAVIRELGDLLNLDAVTVSGRTLGEESAGAECFDRHVIRSLEAPLKERAGLVVLRGNLVPGGGIIKPAAATLELMKHRGPAVVFDSREDLAARLDDPALDIDEHSVMVLRNVGPCGFPGMPEVGKMPLPRRLLERGIRDMVRISDARMSGTAYGSVVVHAAPEGAVGGPIALVRDGDMIELDVERRSLRLEVGEAELDRRRAAWMPSPHQADSGYEQLYVQHVLQADQGADFDFLVGCRGSNPPKSGLS